MALMLAAMSPDARRSASLYYAGSGRSLTADLAALAANPSGVIVWLPQLVALMKPVNHTCPERWQALAESPAGADAWFVHLLTGELSLARQMGVRLPRLPWLCFQRGARSATLHRWRWARFVPTSEH